ncbi:bifunctional Aspartic peptidase domain superfamily/Peptidase family A1 domain/VPS28 [Babesia duncani]|uniref:Bifunctional Aspartic peptidase domain superfamily/Peptidase family A1 domain/VPS28 n=1 Tax=Babesia duncani TaxID=323732 RepID=A0AAD9PGL9_9APIC|nr:bifunctional Aspartic peptidase domain superfamily/Peptidase family A1 domain/VPS28 [Babesia duncani]KAK2195744.1 bifunctional Aspartic peptidase domain superfamily/Peptidase family A1 domain/VPS28 [Babesia duncani]
MIKQMGDGLKIDKLQAADLYSLLYTLEYLERAYIGGFSPIQDYENECSSLLSVCKVLDDATPKIFEDFSMSFGLNYPLALNRIKNGKPAANNNAGSLYKGEKLMLIELSEHFITLVDALKLGSITIDELYPLIHELVTCIRTTSSSSEDNKKLSELSFMDNVYKWHTKLGSMQAHEELSSSEARQLRYLLLLLLLIYNNVSGKPGNETQELCCNATIKYKESNPIYKGPIAKKIIPLLALEPPEIKDINNGSITHISPEDIRSQIHESNWDKAGDGHVTYALRGHGPFGSIGVSDPSSHLTDCCNTQSPKYQNPTVFVESHTELKPIRGHLPKKCIPISHLRHVLYAARVGVGTPQQEIHPIFDTGSTNTWVVNSQCKSSGCLNVNRFAPERSSTFHVWEGSHEDTLEIQFGTGSIVGIIGVDAFKIGDIVVKDQVFGMVTSEIADEKSVNIFKRIHFEGIIGLGFPEMAWKNHVPLFDKYTELLGVDKTFGFYFSNNAAYSAVTIGGADPRFYKGDIVMMPVARQMYWEVKLKEVWIGNERICCNEESYAIFDSGTSFNTFPHDAFMRFKELVPPQEYRDDINLEQFPIIMYVFADGIVAEIKPQQYLFVSKDQLKPAYMQINVPNSHGDTYILGNTAFMQHYYTIFTRASESDPAMVSLNNVINLFRLGLLQQCTLRKRRNI